jgi:arsenate reductase (thioredoxin)
VPIFAWATHDSTWGVEDPAAVKGTDEEKLAAFNRIGKYLENRIKLFAALPISKLDNMKIEEAIDDIGKTQD